MIAPSSPVDPLDRVDVAVDQTGEPADVDRFLDALDRIVERRLKQRKETDPQ